MPVKYGGFGLTSVKDVASATYLASWAHSVATLLKRFPTLWESPELNNTNNIQVSLDNATVEYNDSLGHGDVSQVRGFCDLLVNNTKSFSTVSLPNLFKQSRDVSRDSW